MASKATGAARGLVITAGGDPDDTRGLRLGYVSRCPKGISVTAETHLETEDEGPKLETVRVGVPKEEKINWVLVGDDAVPGFSLQHWMRRTILPDVPWLRGCENVTGPLVGNGGVLDVEELVGDESNDEGETG